ncbi:MAG: hypothetical protein K2X27_03200 [Candidatus Obscuribacterales bacterium]|nr:hypothetical protein [Candidatus Obscuribacterales bacterium]
MRSIQPASLHADQVLLRAEPKHDLIPKIVLTEEPLSQNQSRAPIQEDLLLLLRDFLVWIANSDLSKSSRRVYRSRTKQFIHFVEELEPNWPGFAGCAETAFQEALAFFVRKSELEKILKQSSINNYIRFARIFIRFCNWSLTDLTRLKTIENMPEELPPEALKKYLESLEKFGSSRDKALISLLILSPLNIDEVLKLELADIRIQNSNLDLLFRGQRLRIQIFEEKLRTGIENWVQMRQSQSPESAENWLFPGVKQNGLSRTACDFAVRKYGWKCGVVASIRALKRSLKSRRAVTKDSLNSVNYA